MENSNAPMLNFVLNFSRETANHFENLYSFPESSAGLVLIFIMELIEKYTKLVTFDSKNSITK